MKKLFLIILFTIVNFNLYAQNTPAFDWVKKFGEQAAEIYSYKIENDLSGNIYMIGYFAGTVDFDPGPGIFNLTASVQQIFISKYEENGNFVWARQIDAHNSFVVEHTLVLDHEDNVILAGYFSDTTDFDPGPGIFNLSTQVYEKAFFICKLNSSGDFIWAVKFAESNNAFNKVPVCTDAAGNIYATSIFNVVSDFDGGSGSFFMDPAGGCQFICKLDSSGNFVWARQIGNGSWASAQDMAMDFFANIYLTGYFEDTADFDPGAAVYGFICNSLKCGFVCKLDSGGGFIWARDYGNMNSNNFNLAVDSSENVYISGDYAGALDFDPGTATHILYSGSGNNFGDYNLFVSKLNENGNFIWAREFTHVITPGVAYGRGSLDIRLDSDRNIYTTGYTLGQMDFDPGPAVFYLNLYPGNEVAFISKLDSSGNFIWALPFESGIPYNGGVASQSVSLDPAGNIYTCGLFYGTVDFDPAVSVYDMSASPGAYHQLFLHKLAPVTTGIVENAEFTPVQLYPNPFKQDLQVSYELLKTQMVSLRVVDVLGQTVKVLENETVQPAGKYNYVFKTKTPGLYFINFILNGKVTTGKAIKLN